MTRKCIIVLSEKSSGSSAFQTLLSRFANIRHVPYSRHGRFETLYWTKAASILGRDQIDMLDSEVPISARNARSDLIQLLKENAPGFVVPEDDCALIFDGWKALCEEYEPILLEKSPHHLLQRAAIELIEEAIDKLEDTEFLIVGLVRNPIDTIYSQFKRWGSRPEQMQFQWLTAYKNLLELEARRPDVVTLIRYEDMVRHLSALERVFRFCEIRPTKKDFEYLHTGSVSKWAKDSNFGFCLHTDVFEFAMQLGYSNQDLQNRRKSTWPITRETYRLRRRMLRFFRSNIRTLFGTQTNLQQGNPK